MNNTRCHCLSVQERDQWMLELQNMISTGPRPDGSPRLDSGPPSACQTLAGLLNPLRAALDALPPAVAPPWSPSCRVALVVGVTSYADPAVPCFQDAMHTLQFLPALLPRLGFSAVGVVGGSIRGASEWCPWPPDHCSVPCVQHVGDGTESSIGDAVLWLLQQCAGSNTTLATVFIHGRGQVAACGDRLLLCRDYKPVSPYTQDSAAPPAAQGLVSVGSILQQLCAAMPDGRTVVVADLNYSLGTSSGGLAEPPLPAVPSNGALVVAPHRMVHASVTDDAAACQQNLVEETISLRTSQSLNVKSNAATAASCLTGGHPWSQSGGPSLALLLLFCAVDLDTLGSQSMLCNICAVMDTYRYSDFGACK